MAHQVNGQWVYDPGDKFDVTTGKPLTAAQLTQASSATNSATAPTSTPTSTQTTPDSGNIIGTLRSQIQSGQISTDQAKQQFQNYVQGLLNNGSLRTDAASSMLSGANNALFSGLGQIKTPNGGTGTVDATGNVTVLTNTVNKTTVGSNGITTDTKSFFTPPTITQNLGPGSTGTQVQQLQQWLQQQGYFPAGQQTTTTYGPITQQAVAAWQKANNIDTKGNPGYFGPISQNWIQTNYLQQEGGSGDTNNSNSNGGASTTETDAQLFADAASLGLTQAQWNTMSSSVKAVLAMTGKVNTGLSSMGSTTDMNSLLQQAAQNPALIAKYSDALKVDSSVLSTSIQSIQSQVTQGASDQQRQFQADQKKLAETAASTGQAMSGFREQAKQNLQADESSIIQSSRRSAQDNLNKLGQTFEQTYGSSAMPNMSLAFNTPQTTGLDQMPNLSGTAGTTDNLNYNQIGSITGMQSWNKQQDINTLGTQLYNDSLNTTKVTPIG